MIITIYGHMCYNWCTPEGRVRGNNEGLLALLVVVVVGEARVVRRGELALDKDLEDL